MDQNEPLYWDGTQLCYEDGKVPADVEVLFQTEDANANGKGYVIYTDNIQDKDGNVLVDAGWYIPDNEKGARCSLRGVETEEDEDVVESILWTLNGTEEEE